MIGFFALGLGQMDRTLEWIIPVDRNVVVMPLHVKQGQAIGFENTASQDLWIDLKQRGEFVKSSRRYDEFIFMPNEGDCELIATWKGTKRKQARLRIQRFSILDLKVGSRVRPYPGTVVRMAVIKDRWYALSESHFTVFPQPTGERNALPSPIFRARATESVLFRSLDRSRWVSADELPVHIATLGTKVKFKTGATGIALFQVPRPAEPVFLAKLHGTQVGLDPINGHHPEIYESDFGARSYRTKLYPTNRDNPPMVAIQIEPFSSETASFELPSLVLDGNDVRGEIGRGDLAVYRIPAKPMARHWKFRFESDDFLATLQSWHSSSTYHGVVGNPLQLKLPAGRDGFVLVKPRSPGAFGKFRLSLVPMPMSARSGR